MTDLRPSALDPNWTPRDTRSDHLRLRTLILLRWMAVFGQVVAIAVADRLFGLDLPLLPCFLVIAASVLANLAATFLAPENKRLSETEAMVTLLFDITQLAVLLYLTGGLTNPFALLILAPVTIAANALQLRTALFLGLVAIALVSVLALSSWPLVFATGEVLILPPLFEFGTWLALVIGIAFIGLYARRVSQEIRTMGDALLATRLALAREQQLTDLGGVVAAAAHELGTPLSTITLVAAELEDELDDRPEQREDAALIRREADRCRDILRSMGRAGKDDLLLRRAPVEAILREAAEPHANRGRRLDFLLAPGPGGDPVQPTILRRPETIHSLRNLIQNAVDFAASSVAIEAEWSDKELTVRIVDDGPGFPAGMLGRIGDPFMRPRRDQSQRVARPGYDGMGLGLFIAKTLLKRTGATLSATNRDDETSQSGAVVTLRWPLRRIAADAAAPLGENALIEDGAQR
jgi:two-component system, sensor histidine kinase RegB